MAFSASVWPLATAARQDVDVLELRLLLPVPDRYCTSMAGRYSGELKLSPVRSPALRMLPVFRVTLLRAKVLLLAWRWPPELTTIWCGR